MKFIEKPETVNEYLNNVEFQLSNVQGYLIIKDYESAIIKSECIINDAEMLIQRMKQERLNIIYEELKREHGYWGKNEILEMIDFCNRNNLHAPKEKLTKYK